MKYGDNQSSNALMIYLALTHTVLGTSRALLPSPGLAHRVGNSEAGLKIVLSKRKNVLKYRTEAETVLVGQPSIEQAENRSKLRSSDYIRYLALPLETRMGLCQSGDAF